jgi:uncharacterized protein YjiS (DUF1127 family)
MKATHRKVIRLADLGASGILGANMFGFAIELAGQEAPVSPTQPTIERLTIRRLQSRQRRALAELDDRLLRDIGVIRERDIGVSREKVRREIELFWRI